MLGLHMYIKHMTRSLHCSNLYKTFLNVVISRVKTIAIKKINHRR